jgi:hypothetical protein
LGKHAPPRATSSGGPFTVLEICPRANWIWSTSGLRWIWSIMV